jgi:hypothetical protein
MHSLRDVHKIHAYRAGHAHRPLVRLSVRMLQPENRWADLDEIWYGRYTIGVYPKIVCYKLVQYKTPTDGLG